MDFTIIPMKEPHIAEIAVLETECFSDPWSENSIASELDNPLSLWLVAESFGEVVGYVGSQAVLDEADMMNLAVAPMYRRQGIAEALISELCRRLSENGITTLSLEVRESNSPAIALYEKLGFTLAGVRPNYYFHPRENALILKKKLETV